jgi:hypothetical protein
MENIAPEQFGGALTVLFSSDGKEAISATARQNSLYEYSNTLKSALTILPPEVTKGLFSTYRIVSEENKQSIMNAMISKELMLEDIVHGNNLNNEWINNGNTSEREAYDNNDEWNDLDSPSL